MKLLAYLALFLAGAEWTNAHTIGQRISIDGVVFPDLHAVRAPRLNWPMWNSKLCIQPGEFCSVDDLQKPTFACNDANPYNATTPDVVDVPAGARFGMRWWSCIKELNPEECEYSDEPIGGTHHGPILYYLAKVSDAATANTTGLDWFKIGQDGLDLSTDPGTWATVPGLDPTNGWGYVDLPKCLASGNYLLRAEAISLHAAWAGPWYEGTQHYVSCANINIVGGGSWTGSNHVQFPGAYHPEDEALSITSK